MLGRYDVTMPCGVRGAVENMDKNRERFSFDWQPGTAADGEIRIEWYESGAGIAHEWYPTCWFDLGLRTDWFGDVHSRISSGAPVFSFLGGDGLSRMTVALSDAKTDIACNFGVREENGMLRMRVVIPLASFDHLGKYQIILYISRTNESLARALDRVRAFWEDCGYAPAPVPEAAKKPLYSAWYSYHQATIAHLLEAESKLAAGLGMKTIIVDDGWQTDDGSRGYAFCGDWEPTPNKIPDMRTHVKAVQENGLKYVLWFAVPFIGLHSKAWDRFRGKVLSVIGGDIGVLDPRYPDVREYLIGTYLRALREWGLDGFKLDFIDSFSMGPDSKPFSEGMDIPVLADAVDALMQGIRAALTAEKPDILLEFRQSYIGPLMRGYGNMFRVGDCPMCPDKNRVGVVNLRMLSGNTAVHSDMLMWDAADTPENAMRQLLNVMFGVPQISMRIAELPESHVKALGFWLRFIEENSDILLDSPLEADLPQHLYPCVRAGKDGRYIIGAYQAGYAIRIPSDAREMYLANATCQTEVLLKAPNREATLTTWDVTGQKVNEENVRLSGLCAIHMPDCGLAKITMG